DWPAPEKAVYLQKISKENILPCKHTCDDEDDTSAEQDSESTNQLSTHPHQSTIFDWCVQPLSQMQLEKLHQKLLKAIIYRNITFSIVNNPYLQEYLHDLNPSYHSPSQDMI
ncbi:4576_t:CDS:1, partial [Cetraspora pellucida]